MAQLTVNVLSQTKSTPPLVAAAGGGDSWPNTGKETFRIKNAGGGSINVTFKCNNGGANGKCNLGIAATPAHDVIQAIPNDSAIYEIGPFPTTFNDGTNQLQVTYSGVTTVTVGVVAVPPSA